MRVIGAFLLGVVAVAIMLIFMLIQLLIQLLPLLVVAAVIVGVVAALSRRQRPAPPAFMLVPLPGHPATSSPPQLALPAPHRNPLDVQIFGPISPEDGSSPERWQWR